MFKCDCCGICCRNIRNIEMLAGFDDGTGVCRYLGRENNLCMIYDSRPVVCNVDAMYELFFREEMTREEFYCVNYSACEKLKRRGTAKTEGQKSES